MAFHTTRRQMMAGTAALGTLGGVAATFRRALAQDIPTKPEAGGIKMGVEPWLGYGQWHVAAKKGLFKEQGLESVELVNFTTDADLNAAIASGQLDCGNIATHTAMAFAAAGLPIKIVLLLDVSMTADAMLSDGSITTIPELKGKQIAYEEGTTSDLLLNYALAANGMSIADIQKVPMPAADAGAALIAGKVPVAVTYEPYLTTAMNQNKKAKMIYSAGIEPGLISDVLVVNEKFLQEKPGQVLALLKSWDAAYSAYQMDTTGCRAIISEAVGAKPEELATAFDGVKYYSLKENKEQIGGDYLKKVMPAVKDAATKAGILTKDVDAAALIDPRFVAAA
jgi:NitT/TauT family transport system substrate-binding protein